MRRAAIAAASASEEGRDVTVALGPPFEHAQGRGDRTEKRSGLLRGPTQLRWRTRVTASGFNRHAGATSREPQTRRVDAPTAEVLGAERMGIVCPCRTGRNPEANRRASAPGSAQPVFWMLTYVESVV